MAGLSAVTPVIKLEDSSEPTSVSNVPLESTASNSTPPVPPVTPTAPQPGQDPKDPDRFLSRCNGYNKKNQRCRTPVGVKTANHIRTSHATFLPTCRAHKDQLQHAGRCQFMEPNGERCERVFRWTPPQFELCENHIDHPDTPCYFMKLPTELRQHIYSYLLPTGPIGSSNSSIHNVPSFATGTGLPSSPVNYFPRPPLRPSLQISSNSRFARERPRGMRTHTSQEVTMSTQICGLLLVSRQVYIEAKELLYSTLFFNIDIRKDGTFMCGRRLLEPKGADGLPHHSVDGVQEFAKRFISTFDFTSVKNYNVHIMVENCYNHPSGSLRHWGDWDEEVEIYDIRDYVGVVVSGILSKARNLCKLNVRLAFSKFTWTDDELFVNTKRLVEPFQRLRNIRQPRFLGVYEGTVDAPYMINIPSAGACSVPPLPTHTLLLGLGNTQFDSYRKSWEECLSKTTAVPPQNFPLRAMFTEFKQFYTNLLTIIPKIQRPGKFAFLHRARVAREENDVDAFRELRYHLITYWNLYLENQDAIRRDMDHRLGRLLDADTYPEAESSSMSSNMNRTSSSPISLDADKMAEEGIPMQGNKTLLRPPSHGILKPAAIISRQQSTASGTSFPTQQAIAQQMQIQAQLQACRKPAQLLAEHQTLQQSQPHLPQKPVPQCIHGTRIPFASRIAAQNILTPPMHPQQFGIGTPSRSSWNDMTIKGTDPNPDSTAYDLSSSRPSFAPASSSDIVPSTSADEAMTENSPVASTTSSSAASGKSSTAGSAVESESSRSSASLPSSSDTCGTKRPLCCLSVSGATCLDCGSRLEAASFKTFDYECDELRMDGERPTKRQILNTEWLGDGVGAGDEDGNGNGESEGGGG
ncbi:hypothetical protein GQ43DRAFT_430140 [Delitschia confertaspora ATCC 74209]|uniref:Uncharacterized protein n=1 Tax=Delitschia confertaspora ATCC 74209 TaxID=1513339 RepID=A0A9P4MU20_9PLEO|nr:hypothetical protein GQ43DRAFT_430140 [Delitschia confertaspora ATCC 74209]